MNTADKAYNELLVDIMSNGKVHHNRTSVDTLSVFGRQLRFNLQDGFPLLTGKRVYYKAIFHELLWFLGAVPEEYKQLPQTNIKYLVDNDVKIWNEWPYEAYVKAQPENIDPLTLESFVDEIKRSWEFAAEWGNLGPVYGEQWTNWRSHNTNTFSGVGGQNFEMYETINQIQNAVDRLKTYPDCRRIIVNAWNPGEMLLPLCHYSFQFKSEEMRPMERHYAFLQYARLHNLECTGMSVEGAMKHYKFPKRKLNLLWNQHSVDTFLGLPFNIASYAALLTMMAQVTGHIPSELIFSGGDVHIYSNHTEQITEQLNREGRTLPFLKLNRKIDNIFEFRYDDLEVIAYNPYPAIKGEVAV